MKVELVPAHPDLATALFNVVNASRDWLATWLPWVDHITSVADETAFLRRMQAEADQGRTHMFVIKADGRVVGAIDLHNIDAVNHHADVGYWLGQAHTGQGLTHTALSQLEAKAFGEFGLHKLNIIAAMGNAPSRRVAVSAGYTFEVTLRDEIWRDGYHPAALYTKLAP